MQIKGVGDILTHPGIAGGFKNLVTHESRRIAGEIRRGGGQGAEPREDLLTPATTDDLVAYPVRSDVHDDDPPETLAPSECVKAK